jgi:hypothetical protein
MKTIEITILVKLRLAFSSHVKPNGYRELDDVLLKMPSVNGSFWSATAISIISVSFISMLNELLFLPFWIWIIKILKELIKIIILVNEV